MGVKVTDCGFVPTGGAVLGVVKVKVPAGVDAPPLSVDEASVCP